MDILSYEAHVKDLRREMERAKRFAESTGMVAHVDWCAQARRRWQNACAYLRKRQKKEAIA